MSRVFRHTIEWIVDGRAFRFLTDGQTGMLEQPAGEILTMTVSEWRALADAICQAASQEHGGNNPKAIDHPNQGKAWSAEDDATLRRAWEAGETQGQLAHRFGRSRGAISSRLVRIGLIVRD